MSSIIENYQSEKNFTENFRNFFKIYKLSTALRKANAYKKRGYSVVEIFSYLFQLVFYNRSMYMDALTKRDEIPFMKDTRV